MDLPTFSSIGPEVWGRSFWEFLDAVIATFPRENPSTEQRNAVYDMMQSLRHLLPCPVCRRHYNEFLQKHRLDNALYSRRSLVDFYFLLKKDVAMRTTHTFPFKSPDDLWLNITRRLKLVKTTPPSQLQNIQQKPIFRVPRRTNAVATTTTKKGCGCKK